jgi:hypothetical protein
VSPWQCGASGSLADGWTAFPMSHAPQDRG